MTLENFLETVGKKISAIRKSKKINQKETAQKAGISYRYYQNIETGKANITISTLLRVARFFQVHPADLLPLKGD